VSFPVDNIGYTAGSLFGTGSNLGNNNYVVYNGSGTSTTVVGLSGGTQYFFAVFEYNGFGSNANYLIPNYPEANAIALGFAMTVSSTSGDMCEGDSVQLEVHGAQTYDWTPSGSLSSETDSIVWATPGSTTTYNVLGTDTNSGCTDEKDITITVYNQPNVTIGNFANRCINSGTLTLTSGSPSGGFYSGNGVTGNQFNPSVAGAGGHMISYHYSDIHGCSGSDSSSIVVYSKPNASFPALNDVCIDDAAFTLTGGAPTGGVYSGTGVSNGQFNPANSGAGTFPIRYIYTNSNGCSDTATSNQVVRPLPNVTFANLPDVCLNTSQYPLTGGSPAGGTYSGTGVTSGQFFPQVTGAGTYILT
jgi:hypothetical protein